MHSGDHGVFAVPLGPDRNPVTPDHHADPSHDTDPSHDRRAPAEAAGDSTHPDPNAPDGQPDADRPRVQRPDFMGDPPDIYGRPGLTKDQVEQIQVYRANEEAGYREQYYDKNGRRLLLATKDESGQTPPQLMQLKPDAPWIRAKDAPEPPEPHYLDPDYVPMGRETVTSDERRGELDGFAKRRHDAIDLDNKTRKWRDESGLPEAQTAYKKTHTAIGEATEAFGEAAARHHYIAEKYEGFTDEPLLGPANGNDQFDQVWTNDDGRVVVVEAKSSTDTKLGSRIVEANGERNIVSQGSREYFNDIIREMTERGETKLVTKIITALHTGNLEYIVVKGEKNSGSYTGLQYRRFDISKGTLP
ncbi:hypothetical protein [Kitasatospora sp. NPDC088134]|uniref:hypothetical protein n=1 Tax=Kitasatospora sp. NPDC088134 TaxID=3364071 RepID=UPI003805D868